MPLDGQLCHALGGVTGSSIVLTVLRPTVPVSKLLRASAELRSRGAGASSDTHLSGAGSSDAVELAADEHGVDGHTLATAGGGGTDVCASL